MALFFSLIGVFAVCGCGEDVTPPETLLRQAKAALAAGEYKRAEQLAVSIPADAKESVAARLLAGEAATKDGRLQQALKHYLSIRRGSAGIEDFTLAQFSAAEVYRERGDLTNAEQSFRNVLADEPQNMATHERLAFLLSTTGRRWEAVPHYFALVRSGTATVNELVLLADVDRPVERREYLEELALRSPDDQCVQLGLAAHDFWDGEAVKAERRLRSVLNVAPELTAGQALLGELLVDQSAEKFLKWNSDLPDAAADHPDIWYVRGLWARREGRLDVAARCFWQCVRLAPTHRRATYQLGQVLTVLERDGVAEFSDRANLLIELSQALDDVLRSNGEREEPWRRSTQILDQTGRIWEACAWALLARDRFPQAEWPDEILSRNGELLTDQLPLTQDSADLSTRYDLSQLPNFQTIIAIDREPDGGSPVAKSDAVIGFSDGQSGPGFTYFSSPDPSTKGARMFEVNGGGVAAFDFDGDARIDVYFTQGTQWNHGESAPSPSEKYTDRIFRNRFDTFGDVTKFAFSGGTANLGYGQGCSAVDFDNDGFQDLYVANIGRNRLYRNNGDGTFSDVTDQAALKHEQWTASCVGVDLNADGLPDLFDVNYLEGKGIFTDLCSGKACSPSNFEGARDRLLISRGDGTFEEVLDATPSADAKGLGVVAVDIDRRGRPSLFIANDQVANFLLRSEPSNDPFNVTLTNAGFDCGLAFNEDGLSMACMGIAADDCDGNGRVDFFVTNFSDESNSLYLQDAPGLFIDATKQSGLRTASYAYVGWGTQFLDADLDGHPDIVLTNGHVDDYTDEDGEYHMRPQFFRNEGGGRFVELLDDQLGPYFGHKYLGRGLARLDWNRDGLMDFIVSNIEEPASLVTNETRRAGHFINFRLHAATTARDAIGALVTVNTADRAWTKTLTTGDGYMASNERTLQFGIGPATEIASLEIVWPSGATTRAENIPADRTLEVVEGRSAAALWHGDQPDSFSVTVTDGSREP